MGAKTEKYLIRTHNKVTLKLGDIVLITQLA